MSHDLKVIPPVGSIQGPEVTQLSVWWQLEFYLLLSVTVENAYLPLDSGAIVNPKNDAITSNIIREVGGDVCLPTHNASLEHPEERIRSKDREMIFGLPVRR